MPKRSPTEFMLLSGEPRLRAEQVRYGQLVDQARQQAENRAALREAMRPAEELPSSRVPSAAEYALNSRIAAANREEKPSSALGVIRRELPRFFKADDELADAMGDFSLRQGTTATAGALGALAAPAYLPMRSALARVLSGVALTNAGDRMLDPAAKKVLGTEISDPAASTVFGALAGKTGKIGVPLLASLAASSGDAEAGALSALRRRIFSQGDHFDLGDATRNIRQRVVIEEDPKLRENEFNKKALIDQLYRDAEQHKDLYTQAFLDDKGNAVGLYQTRRQPGKGTSLNYMISDQPGLGTEMLEEVYRFAPERPVTLHALPGTEDFYRRFPEWEEDRSEGVSKFIRKAGGGIVRKALEKFGRRAAHSGDIDVSVEAPRGAMSVVKQKGGNWLSGSVEDALKGLKQRAYDARNTEEAVSKTSALNNWIDKQLTRYVKNEMATPEDPIRALAERGVLHFTPDWVPEAGPARYQRGAAFGNVGKGAPRMGETPLAQDWEDLTDTSVDTLYKGTSIPLSAYPANPWLSKLEQGAAVHKADLDNLGFPHLIDELSNALNPESGLPRELLLDPKSLERVSVPQAVERVAKINAWRAAQKAEADALRANNAATQVFKEYPENNPLGLRWVELKAPEQVDLAAVKRAPHWENPDEAFLTHQGRRQALQDALKYEGDIMGHCVGGYCDDVLTGRSRIYSLRDAKGQPHVTIETAPPYHEGFSAHGDWDKLPEDLQEQLMKDYGSGSVGWAYRVQEDPRVKAWAAENMPPPPARIKQIKGKQNRAPNPEYLPFVQDFVRSGKWSDVGDYKNAGLIDRLSLPGDVLTPDTPQYLTPDEVRAMGVDPDSLFKNFAHGGSVESNKATWPTCKCDYKEQRDAA